MKNCAAAKCTNRGYTAQKELHYHVFPRNRERCKKWLRNCGNKALHRAFDQKEIDEKYLNQNYVICSDHFEPSQYVNPESQRLNWSAVPTVFNLSSASVTGEEKNDNSSSKNASQLNDCNNEKCEGQSDAELCEERIMFHPSRPRGKHCVYTGCKKNSSSQHLPAHLSAVLHKFPQDEERCKQWMINAGLAHRLQEWVKVSVSSRLCSDHFQDKYYFTFGGASPRQRLRKDAIPTLFGQKKEPERCLMRGCCSVKGECDPWIHFLQFPEEENLSLYWRERSGRCHDDIMSLSAYEAQCLLTLCSIHFEDSQFEDVNKTRLKTNAVPTIMPNVVSNPLLTQKHNEPETDDIPTVKLLRTLMDKAALLTKNELLQTYEKHMRLLVKENNRLKDEVKNLKASLTSESEKNVSKCMTSDADGASVLSDLEADIKSAEIYSTSSHRELLQDGEYTNRLTDDLIQSRSTHDNIKVETQYSCTNKFPARFSVQFRKSPQDVTRTGYKVNSPKSLVSCSSCGQSWTSVDPFIAHFSKCVFSGKKLADGQIARLKTQLLKIQSKQIQGKEQRKQEENSTSDTKTQETESITVKKLSKQSQQTKPRAKLLMREFVCDYCGTLVYNVDDFLSHARECFLQDANGLGAVDVNPLREQLLAVTKNTKFLLNEDDLKEVCSRKQSLRSCTEESRSKIQNKTHSNVRLMKPGMCMCMFCSKVFKTLFKVKQHEKNVHGERNVQCSQCPRRFTTQKRLTAHLKSVHFGDYKHQCNLCGRLFKNKQSLVRHERLESQGPSDYKHTCKVCGANFKAPSALKRHMLSHQKLEKYKCFKCHRSYSKEVFLKGHEKSHYQNHMCNCCKRSFGYESHLVRHKMTVHGERSKLPCSFCAEAFYTEERLATHIQTQHAVQSDEAASRIQEVVIKEPDLLKSDPLSLKLTSVEPMPVSQEIITDTSKYLI